MIIALYLAGGLQLLIASSNLFAPRLLRYPENLARLDRTVRDIFVIQCAYIMLTLIAFAALCIAIPHELVDGSVLGRCICGFLTFFWGLRLLLQVVHYNSNIKRKYPFYNFLFLATFVILTGIFAAATVR